MAPAASPVFLDMSSLELPQAFEESFEFETEVDAYDTVPAGRTLFEQMSSFTLDVAAPSSPMEPPRAPRLRPVAAPAIMELMPELELPCCALDMEELAFEEMFSLFLDVAAPSSPLEPPRAPRLRPAAAPVDVDLLAELELPGCALDLDDEEMCPAVEPPGLAKMRFSTAPFDLELIPAFELPGAEDDDSSSESEDLGEAEEDHMMFDFDEDASGSASDSENYEQKLGGLFFVYTEPEDEAPLKQASKGLSSTCSTACSSPPEMQSLFGRTKCVELPPSLAELEAFRLA